MADLLLTSIEYGGYISPIKFIVFLVLFFLWLPLLMWIYRDAEAVEGREVFWTAIVLGTGAVATIIWLVVPLFIIGLLFYLITVGTTAIVYVVHRNARVLEFERVLTVEHIKSLLSTSEQKKLDNLKNFLFITANNNEIPMPRPKTTDYFGYRVAYDIFTDATWRRASRIVFSPTQAEYNTTYHIDGAALKQPAIDIDQIKYFIRFIKSLADLDVNEKRKPQRGKFKIRQDKESTEWEITTAGSTAGEQIQLRQVTQQSIKRLADLGLMPEQVEQLNKLREAKGGLFIVTGPKKTGVTTTFYALLRNHDAFLNSIEVLETHPSADLPNITQKVFAPSDTDTTAYAKRLRSIVRMGPDIIGVADCKNTETAHVACQAAKDGRTVYVTFEADNVIQAFGKWLKLVGDRNFATETLSGISSQRLLRKLCNECKQAYRPNKELLKKFNVPAEKAKVLYRPGKVQYDKHGKPTTCENCQGIGFVGRTGVFEAIIINDQLRKAVKQSKSLPEIGKQFRNAKMLYLQEQALRKVIGGITAVNEMVRVFSTPKKKRTGTKIAVSE